MLLAASHSPNFIYAHILNYHYERANGPVDSIKAAAAMIAADLFDMYHGDEPGQTLGILPGPPPDGPYYWWNAGAMWGTYLDYWKTTGDTTYNDEVERSLVFQSGERHNYEPKNWTASLGNDDQSFWGMSAMLAAELNFQNPPPEDPQWLALAQAVFNRQAMPERHDDVCGGGMRWQIPRYNTGFDYKNTIANGCFFNIGARLGRYTNNDTYIRYAEETWDWLVAVNYISENYDVYDGGHDYANCTNIFKVQFSYNAGVLIQGLASLYNHVSPEASFASNLTSCCTFIANNLQTGDVKWKTHLDGMVETTLTYFFERPEHQGIMFEVGCEEAGENDTNGCTTDMLSFKGFLHRWLANAIQLAPHLYDRVYPLLLSSAKAAVAQCTGGENGRMCGFKWSTGVFDGNIGAGEQMNVLGALSSVLVRLEDGPVTNTTGGTSKGDYLAGTDPDPDPLPPISNGDIAGASILTAVVSIAMVSTYVWMSTDISETK